MAPTGFSYRFFVFLRLLKLKASRVKLPNFVRGAGVFLVVLSALGSFSPAPTPAAKREPEVRNESVPPPPLAEFPRRAADSSDLAAISAESAYVIDLQTGVPLFAKNEKVRRPMASLTKVMTALVILETTPLDNVAIVPAVCTTLPPNNMGLIAGEEITTLNLLYGLLVQSSADAACALAHNFKGDFLARMNQTAERLGLYDTQFENEVGFDGENGNHRTTAYDMAVLSKEAMKNPTFRRIVGTRQISVGDVSGGLSHNLATTNELLAEFPGVTGIKTGFTEKALGCLSLSFELVGREIVVVVLGSNDRFGDAKEIVDWVFRSYVF